MSRKNNIAELTKELMKEGNIKDVSNLQSMLMEIIKNGVESLPEVEMVKQKNKI